MQNCDFCQRPGDNLDQTCCSGSKVVCQPCVINGNINQFTTCTKCQKPMGKKFKSLKARIILDNANGHGMSQQQFPRAPNEDENDLDNMPYTMKKNQGFRGNHQTMNSFHNQNLYPPNQNGYSRYGMGINNYSQSYLPPPPYYAYGQPYMPQNPQMSHPNHHGPQYNYNNPYIYGHNPHVGSTQGCYMPSPQFNSRFEQQVYYKMMNNASRGMMPHNYAPQEQEGQRGMGRYWHGQHNNIVYNRSQNKTTDMLEQSVIKNKVSRIQRSSSVTGFGKRS